MRGHIKKFFILLIGLILTQKAEAQFFTLGSDPGTAVWRIIKTDHYSLIYPKEIDSLARIYLYEMERIRDKVNEPMMTNPERIPVILHPYYTLSNGSVAWAPKRVDLITSPDPYDGSADYWQRHLVAHELRHVAQITHYTKGPYKFLYYILGEQSTGIGLGLFANKSVMEGDGVISETELSQSGRGRSADFNKHLRAMYLSDEFRNWDRMYLGSFYRKTPNQYEFGYHLDGYIRYITNRFTITGQYFKIPVENWYKPSAFLFPIQYATGVKRVNFFPKSQQDLKQMWMKDLLTRGELTTPDTVVKKTDKLYADLENPILVNCPGSKYHNQIIARKEGLQHNSKLMRIDSLGKEHFIKFFSPSTSGLVYNGYDKIYWTESISNSAADLETFSIVKYLDLKSGRVRSLKKRTKYFNPAPSADGKTIAVSEYEIGGKTYLTYIDSKKGNVISRIESPDHGQVKENTYFKGEVYSTIVTKDGMAIYKNVGSSWKRISKIQHQSISHLRSTDDFIYFTSDLDGVLNTYTYYPDKDSLVRITNSKFGANFPYITNGTLYYSDFTLNGYKLAKNKIEELKPVVKNFAEPYLFPMAEFISQQQKDSSKVSYNENIDTFDEEKYPSKFYSKTLHAFRIHSWYPLYLDLSQLQNFSFNKIFKVVAPGITLLSQNSLGNIKAQISYAYMNRRHTGHFSINTKLIGNFSAELKMTLNQREQYYYLVDYNNYELIQMVDPNTPQFTAAFSLYYPLNFDSGGWYRLLNPQATLYFDNDGFYSYTHGEYRFKHQIMYGISYEQVLGTSSAAIYPRWGFGVRIFGGSAPGTGENFGNMAFASAFGYIPGIVRGQGLKITVQGQHQFADGKTYYLSSIAELPRGYKSNNANTTETYFKVTADYAIPIYLGDVSLSSILYFKRLQLIPFGDFAMDINPREKKIYYSYGADILVDFNLLRLAFPLSLGMRYARTGFHKNYFGFLANISF